MKTPAYTIERGPTPGVAPTDLVVRDVGPWSRYPTITNAAEELVADLGDQLTPGRRLFYYDSEGRLDEIRLRADSQRGAVFAGFAPGPKPPSTFEVSSLTLVTKDNLLALVSVKVAGVIYLTGIRVIQGKGGLFIAMPSRKTVNGEYQDIYFAAARETRDELSGLVLAAYDAELAKAKVPA